MRHCIPDELFNLVPYLGTLDNAGDVGIDGIYNSVAYKLPGAEEVAVRREAWHTLCDFCGRTGALQRRVANDAGNSVRLAFGNGEKLLRIVGAEAGGGRTADFAVVENAETGVLTVAFGDDVSSCAVYASVRPAFDHAEKTDGKWAPKVPRYVIDRYGECIAHGALARLYAMRGAGEMARMHATAYNNDLNRLAFGLITAGMRKHLLIDVEDWLVNTNGNG